MNPSNTQISALVERAGVWFIYAATAVRYIDYDNFHRNPFGRLHTILNGPRGQRTTEHTEVDRLYTTILEAAFRDEGLEEADQVDMQRVLHTVICAREPLTVEGLSELLQISDPHRVRAALRPYWSVLYVVEPIELVTTLHASFHDYMMDLTRSKAHHCDAKAHNQEIAERCFGCITRLQSQFNICGLETSFLLDENVPNIEECMSKTIPLELFYSCRYWADHVKEGACALDLRKQMEDFLSKRLLLWMEILNLKGAIMSGVEIMKRTLDWCKSTEGDPQFVELANDALIFVQTFALNPVSRSTPHIYVSMLAFWPKSAPISRYYAEYAQGPVRGEGTALERRKIAHLGTWAFEKFISAMALSPDGLHLALAIHNEIVVVDSSSGRVILGPMSDHIAAVQSVAYSPNMETLIAGSFKFELPSRYATIVGWNTHTGVLTLGPLTLGGHTGLITSLSISPDCTKIATVSDIDDRSIYLWDANNGEILHSTSTWGMIDAAAFSPDGMQIAAGFGSALKMWDIQTGHTVLGPSTSPDRIGVIVFSPDKSRIFYSYQFDSKNIRVWHVQPRDTTPKSATWEGHTSEITCIGVSPNGRRLVSGCSDGTVRVWDTQNGELELGPLEGHSSWVTSVAFLPDETCIISTCVNGLVCRWDAQQRNLMASTTNLPFSDTNCVKFSSNGACFISSYGCEVDSMHIWDTHSGESIAGPIKVHTVRIQTIESLNTCVALGYVDGILRVSDHHDGDYTGVRSQGRIEGLTFSPDGKLIVTASHKLLEDKGSTIQVWDASTGSRVLDPLTGLDGYVISIQFSPDGSRIVAGSINVNWNISVWDVTNGANMFGALEGHSNSVLDIAYSPNGALIASGSHDTTIILWNAYTGEMALDPLVGHADDVRSIDFSPDCMRLVSSSDDKTIRIWDVQTGGTLFELPSGHESNITSVEYSPDGTLIMSLSYDMSVRIHDARSDEERALSSSPSDISDWTINKDGWVVDDQSRLLVWIPGSLRRALLWPRTQVMASPHGYLRLKFDKSRMGESWAQSYTSHS